MANIEAIIVDGVRYDKVKAKTKFVCEECELREVCEENGDFAIACGDALSSDNEYWKERNNNMNSYKTKNEVDVWVTRTYDCEPNLGGFYCQIYLDKDLERELDDFVIPAEVVNDNKEEEFIMDFISNYCADVTYEMCPHCGNEVVLYAEKKEQICPDCKMWIAPCSLCDNCIKPCSLEIDCNRKNSLRLIKKELPKREWDIISDLVLKELGNIREFSNAHGEAVRKALETEIGKLHTLYNFLID